MSEINWSKRWSQRSIDRLKSCRDDIQQIMNRAIELLPPEMDMTVLEGARSKAQQLENIRKGVSKTLNSRHLDRPSRAVDVAPYPVDWDDEGRFKKLAPYIKQASNDLGLPIHWGFDLWGWDMPHWQVD